MYYEFNCRTTEEFSVCQRCGVSYELTEKTSYGWCMIWYKRGAGQSFSLAEPVNDELIELGLPQEFTAYGYLKSNCYRGKITKELSLLDLCA